MKPVYRLVIVAGFTLFSCAFLLSMPVTAQSIISGTIFDRAHNPLADIDVELLDEYYRMRSRQKTQSSGRYEFSGLNSGTYYVRVYAFRYDLNDETHEVQVAAVSAIPGQQGTSFNLEDFYLQPKKGGIREAELTVVFTQEVPKEAEQTYKKAIDDLSKKKADEGFAGLQRAIELFPTYYQALQRLGTELFLRRQYLPAAQAFIKAAEVNPKSAMPFYNAGYALYMLGDKYYKSSLTALEAAVNLAPASSTVLLLIGTVERKMGKETAAEKHLLQAKKNSPTKVPEIHRELAQLYDSMGRYKDAADELEDYMKASKMSDEDSTKTKKVIADLRAKSQAKTAN